MAQQQQEVTRLQTLHTKDDVKLQGPRLPPKQYKKLFPVCVQAVNLRPEGNFPFEKFGFWCWPVVEKPKCIENAAFVMKKKEVCCSIVLCSSSRWSQKVFSAFSIPVAVSLSHQCHHGCKRTILGRQPAFFLVSGLLQGSSQSHSMFFQCQTQSSYYFCPTTTKVLPLPIF